MLKTFSRFIEIPFTKIYDVMSSDRKDSEQDLSQYVSAVKEIKNAILDSRYRVARQANKEVLQLNYGIGRFISVNSRSAKWGSNAISVISKMLQQELPGLKGFSEASIKMMRIFYEEWCLIFENRQLPIDDLGNPIIDSISSDNIRIEEFDTDKLSESDLSYFLNVGFTNHYIIISRTTTLEERLYYIRRCATEFWKVETTKYYLKEDLYHKEGSIQQTNFEKTIEESDFKEKALQSFKEEYQLDFINTEDISEKVIEQQVVLNIKNFIMAFGPEFTFMGNQYRLEVSGKEFFIDLLFFSRRLKSLVAFELKRGEFKPEYTGKMNFYLAALDKYVKLPDENPSIGIILCKSKNEEIVELSFSDTSKPMGVATFRTSQELPERFRKALPNIEDLKKLL